MNLPPIDIKKLTRKRRTDPLESKIEREVCEYARAHGIPHRKFTPPAQRGAPDRVFLLGNEKVAFIEFKRGGERPTPNQEREHTKLRSLGYIVEVVDNIKQGKKVIDLWVSLYK